MFKRTFWMTTGVAVGASGAFWAKRKVEATVERYLPDQVAERAASSAKGLTRTVKEAATEGRAAMRATEAELRARVEARTYVGERPTPEAATPAAQVPTTARPAKGGHRRTSRVPAARPTAPGARRQARR